MIVVEVGEQDVTNPLLFVQSQRGPHGPGIHQHGLIDQEGAGPALVSPAAPIQDLVRAMAAQHADLHREVPKAARRSPQKVGLG